MKTTIALGTAAVLSLLALSPVLAQDTSSQPSSAASSEASSAMSMQLSTEPTAVDYGQIIASLQTGKMADLATIDESSTITFVLMSDLKANGDATALDAALQNNADAATLKSNVDANEALSEKLSAANYTKDQVVAVTANDDGSFTVVINDQHP